MEYSLWLENRALELRRNPTSSEKSLMKFLKRYKVSFRFQVPIMCRENKGYIADFLFSNNIILEVDGESHSSDEAKEYDRERTTLLSGLGYKVIRIMNVSTNPNRIKNTIPKILNKYNIGFTKPKGTPKRSGKPKKKEETKKKYDRRYDPDFKSKLYAVNGWY